MPEPTSNTAAAVVISGVGAGTIGTTLGLDPCALFWAFLGALCSRAIQPRISDMTEIIQAGGWGMISTVIGTFGSHWIHPTAVHFAPYLGDLDIPMLIALPAFMLGLLGHEVILRIVGLIREFKKEPQ